MKRPTNGQNLNTGIKLDPNLEQFATERQWQLLKAWQEHGAVRAAAEAINCQISRFSMAKKAVLRRAAQHGYAPEFDLTHPVAPGMTSRGTSIKYRDDGSIIEYWNKTKQEGRDPEEAFKLPDPKTIVKLSTNYDAEGRVLSQWVAEKPSAVQAVQAWTDFAKALADEYAKPLEQPLPPPAAASDDDLLSVYPVGDHHMGMLSWSVETGANWDIQIAEHCLGRAFDMLVDSSPPSKHCLIPFLGDLFHYDSFVPETPAHKNKLDADSRYPKMASATLRAVRYAIEGAAAKHEHVHVIPEIGNHDESLMVILALSLANIYENEPRITIDISPRLYHYYRFGKTLIGTHHGHKTKMPDLPLIMAADRPDDWGQTTHRYWYTGHLHNKEVLVKDFTGCRVERFCVLPPVDAWAHQAGYRSIREMNSILIHREHGEVGRNVVNPAMFPHPSEA